MNLNEVNKCKAVKRSDLTLVTLANLNELRMVF